MCVHQHIELFKQAKHTSNTTISCCLGYTMVRERRAGLRDPQTSVPLISEVSGGGHAAMASGAGTN